MSRPTALVIGATDAAVLAACPPHLSTVARFAAVADDLHTVVSQVLWLALADLSATDTGEFPELAEDVCAVPVVLAADDYLVDVSTVFVRRCDQVRPRLKPSDCLRLEISEPLRRFAVLTGWHGPAQVLVANGRAAEQAIRLAPALLGSSHAAVVVCELRAAREPDPADTGRNPCGPYLVVARALVGGDGGPADATSQDPYLRSSLLGMAALA